jgi:hypothetical protein
MIWIGFSSVEALSESLSVGRIRVYHCLEAFTMKSPGQDIYIKLDLLHVAPVVGRIWGDIARN